MSVINRDSPSDELSTIFSTLPGQFPDVEENGNAKIKTREFLDASTGVVTLVEKFGKVFAPVVHDMNGNIRKLDNKYVEDTNGYEFLEDMILKQRDGGDMIVVDALMWLRRGLHFMARFFELVIESNDDNAQDLSPFIKSAYKETLERYHGWLGTQLFIILSRFTPSRQTLYYGLALESHDKEKQVLADLRSYTTRMLNCVRKLMDFYLEHDLETNNRV